MVLRYALPALWLALAVWSEEAVQAQAPESGLALVRDGRALGTLVTPDNPLPVVAYAAQELQYHIERSTGVKLPIARESDRPERGVAIVLGACRRTTAANLLATTFAPNEFIIKRVGEEVFLVGDDSAGEVLGFLVHNWTRVGTLFAVYHLLEQELGVRWLWPGPLGEVIPRRKSLTLRNWDERRKPELVNARLCDGIFADDLGWRSLEAKQQYLRDQAVWLRRHRMAVGMPVAFGHAFADYWRRFGDSQPGMFNLLPDGTRTADPMYFSGATNLISMCVSEPAFHRQIVADWLAHRSAACPSIDACENDTVGRCTCPNCLAWDVPGAGSEVPFAQRLAAAQKAFAAKDPDWTRCLGSLADRYARFYLAVQAEAAKTDPNAVVCGYAYANYQEPPLKTRLNDRIFIEIVPGTIYPWNAATTRSFLKQWDGWAATGARLFLRPNYFLAGHDLPVFFARRFGEEFAHARQHGLGGTFFDSLTGQWAAQGPNLYVLARMHHGPLLPVANVLEEYYSGFGPAAGAVRRYFAHWERVADATTPERLAEIEKQRGPSSTHWSAFYRGADGIYTPEVMAAGRALLDNARQAAAGDLVATARVAFLDKGLRNAELTLAAQAALVRYQGAGDLPGYRDAMVALDDYRASVEGDDVANMSYLAWAESNAWNRPALRAMADMGTPLPDTWRFSWDEEEVGLTEGWQADEYDDARWSPMAVSGSWETQPIGKAYRAAQGRDYDGIGWYRNRFTVAPPDRGRALRLIFGAVDEACQVWINGRKVLERPYPFKGDTESWHKAFEVDVTDAVRTDRPNSVAVRVEDRNGAGGVCSPVFLLAYDAPAAGNVVPNPGFEARDSGWSKSVMAGEYDLAVDPEQAHTGSASGMVRCKVVPTEKKGSARAWARWYNVAVPVKAGTTYRLRAFVKTDPQFIGKIVLTITGTTRAEIVNAEMLSTSGLWREIKIEGVVPRGDTVAIYLNSMDGAGSVWFDDVELTPMGAP